MLILGIETAGRRAGVALLDDERVLTSSSGTGPHSAVLLPLIAEALASQGRTPDELDLIGVASGPGAYTGLRVGVVTAKLLGRATGAAVLGVPTLEAMARRAPAEAGTVLVALHAYKKRFLIARFERRDDRALSPISPPELVQADEVPPLVDQAVVITDAPELLEGVRELGAPLPPLDACAVAVAELARARLLAGAADEAAALAPTYLRPPPVTLKADRGAPAR